MELRHPAYTRIIVVGGIILCLCLSLVAAFFTWYLRQIVHDIPYSSLVATFGIAFFGFAMDHFYRMRFFFYVYTLTPDSLSCYSPFSRTVETIRTRESVYLTTISVNGVSDDNMFLNEAGVWYPTVGQKYGSLKPCPTILKSNSNFIPYCGRDRRFLPVYCFSYGNSNCKRIWQIPSQSGFASIGSIHDSRW
jgi:hypothetical protein